MHNELVHVARLLGEARDAVAALLAAAELVLEDGVVLGAYDGEVVGRHFFFFSALFPLVFCFFFRFSPFPFPFFLFFIFALSFPFHYIKYLTWEICA